MKVLLTHPPEFRRQYYGERALGELQALADVTLHDGPDPLSPAALVRAAQGVDVIVADRMTAGPAEVFDRLPALRAFLRCAVDIRNIDVEAASAAGVLVTQAGPGFVKSTAEMALALVLDLARGVARSTVAYQAGRPPEIRMGRQLSGSTIGLIGYGRIARHLAPILTAIGMDVLVADPHVAVADSRFSQVALDDLLARSDFVVCLAVATEATENLMDASAFARMRPSAFFINVSRGNLVNEAALAAALATGRIAGAALDVGRAPDQMPTPGLAGLPGVTATPHVGGLTPPAIESQALDTVAQVAALVRGAVPAGTVNADHWTRRIRPEG